MRRAYVALLVLATEFSMTLCNIVMKRSLGVMEYPASQLYFFDIQGVKAVKITHEEEFLKINYNENKNKLVQYLHTLINLSRGFSSPDVFLQSNSTPIGALVSLTE